MTKRRMMGDALFGLSDCSEDGFVITPEETLALANWKNDPEEDHRWAEANRQFNALLNASRDDPEDEP
jgi:hypothetical protein